MSSTFVMLCIFNVIELAIVFALLLNMFNGNNKTQG